MAKVPFTSGKDSEKGDPSGGHTSKGHTPAAGNTTGSTSKKNTRVGNLSKRMHGASGTKGYPK